MLAAIHSRLDAGMSYPTALQAALRLVMPDGAELLSSPNDTLGVCYVRALLRLGSPMRAFCVKRTGDFRSGALADGASSATAVRGAVLRGDWAGAARAMPESCFTLLRQEALAGRLHRPDALDAPLLYRLRSMNDAEWAGLPGLS